VQFVSWIVSKDRWWKDLLSQFDLFHDTIPLSRIYCWLAVIFYISPNGQNDNTSTRTRRSAPARKCSRARPMHPLDSDARIRKYLNLIAGHDRYIAAVISVLITRVHWAVAQLSGVTSVLRVAKSPREMRKVETREIVRETERAIYYFSPRINIRYEALHWYAHEACGIIGNKRYLGCDARGEILINRPTRTRTRIINWFAHEMFTENNLGNLAEETA